MQKRGFHPTFLLFKEPMSLRKILPTRHAVLLEEGKEKFEEGKEKFEEGKEKFEEGKF